MIMERRREARITNASASFLVCDANGTKIQCSVKNLSRRGIGVTLPENFQATEYPVGSQILGQLIIHNTVLDTKVTVRVSRDLFRGLEFTDNDKNFRNSIGRLLSQQYIASSITPVRAEELANHLEYAFRGADFEVLSFKTGKSKIRPMLQIFAGGNIVEISGSEARCVPAPLVRRTGDNSDYSFMLEFSEEEEEGTHSLNLTEFFKWLKEIVNEWPACPLDFRQAVDAQLQKKSPLSKNYFPS